MQIIINKTNDSYIYGEDIIIGKWIETTECLTHYDTKQKELSDLCALIYRDNENLKPHGFFENLFKKDKNKIKIAQNEESCLLNWRPQQD